MGAKAPKGGNYCMLSIHPRLGGAWVKQARRLAARPAQKKPFGVALLAPQVNCGPRYRCGQDTCEQPLGRGRRKARLNGPKMTLMAIFEHLREQPVSRGRRKARLKSL